MTTNTLLNHYLYEIDDKVVEVHDSFVEDEFIVVIGMDGKRHFISLLDYITFVFNKSFSGDL